MPIDPIVEHCRAIIERGSRSFTRAGSLLPTAIRDGGFQLYAWCRHCDDLVDDQVLGHARDQVRPVDPIADRARLDSLRTRTATVLAGGDDPDPVFRGLARTVARHRIPPHHPMEFLDGMAMDVEGRRFRTLDELTVYCYHVAGVVAVMVAHVMGIRDPATLERAKQLGIAMQLTNIARDIKDDAAIGRVYLPLDWLDQAGLAPAEVGTEAASPRVAVLVTRLLDAADLRYAVSDSGLDHLPFRSAWAITSARHIYADIGRVIRARGAAAWDRRSYISDRRKYLLVAKSLVATALQLRPRSFNRLRSPA